MSHLANPSRKSLSELPALYRYSLDRYTTLNGLLSYTAVADNTPRVVVPDHDYLRLRIMFECHDAPSGGHRGRENTYLTVSRTFYWPRQYQFVRKYIRFLRSLSTSEAYPFIPCATTTSAGPGRVSGVRFYGLCLRIPRRFSQE